ncbi:MAG: hypothetical protein NTW19_13280 [Planctomycetota bacterium]|nr:hypothetical protein [Planctomycetota bacterium]
MRRTFHIAANLSAVFGLTLLALQCVSGRREMFDADFTIKGVIFRLAPGEIVVCTGFEPFLNNYFVGKEGDDSWFNSRIAPGLTRNDYLLGLLTRFDTATSESWALEIPLARWIKAANVLPVLWLIDRTIRKRKRRTPGHCRRCGYDLRASKESCPECGEAIVAAEEHGQSA